MAFLRSNVNGGSGGSIVIDANTLSVEDPAARINAQGGLGGGGGKLVLLGGASIAENGIQFLLFLGTLSFF